MLAFAVSLLMPACGGKGAPPKGGVGRVMISGTNIVGAQDGKPVQLRGFVFTAGAWFDTPPGSSNGDLANLGFMQSEADFAQIAGWGANLAVLYLNYRWFDDPAGWAFIDEVAGWCRAHHLYLLPSLVVYPGGGQRGGPAFFADPGLKDKARQFWVDFATRYKGHAEFAGYDVLNEPQGVSADEIVSYQTTLVDAVRAVDPDAVIFIEPQWGDPYSLRKVPRDGLVYEAHYYLPFYFTGQLFPWLYGGAIPAGVHYPNTDASLVDNVVVASHANDPATPAGTYDWQAVERTYSIPAATELIFVKVFSNGDSGATVYFDDIQAALDGGAFAPIPNGSFETKADVFPDAAYWQAWIQSTGSVARTNDSAADGQWSVKIANSGGWSHYTTHPGVDASGNSIYFLGTTSGLAANGASTLRLRWMNKAAGATAGKNGVEVYFCTVSRRSYGKTDLQSDLSTTVRTPSQTFDAPILIGEFSPSLVGTRPDGLDWTTDVIDYANANGISWAYYHYREVKDQLRYLGLYEGPFGTATDYATGDAEVLARVKAGLAPAM